MTRDDLRDRLDDLAADTYDVLLPVVMERAEAEQAGFPIRGEADGSLDPYRNKFRDPPDPNDGEDLVVADVPPDALTSAFADIEEQRGGGS